MGGGARHAGLVPPEARCDNHDGKIARDGIGVPLGRLDAGATASWLSAVGFHGDASDVHRLSEGNPFFIEEAVRLGVDRFAMAAAGGVALILSEHFARISPGTRETLAEVAKRVRDRAVRWLRRHGYVDERAGPASGAAAAPAPPAETAPPRCPPVTDARRPGKLRCGGLPLSSHALASRCASSLMDP